MLDIREARPEDFGAIHSLRCQIHSLHLKNRSDIYEDIDPLTSEEYTQMLENEKVILLIASQSQIIIGYAFAIMKPPSSVPQIKSRNVVFVEDLCVDQAFQKCGVGKALLYAVKEESLHRGADSIELMVWSFNTNAASFYEHLGMTPRSVILEQKL